MNNDEAAEPNAVEGDAVEGEEEGVDEETKFCRLVAKFPELDMRLNSLRDRLDGVSESWS